MINDYDIVLCMIRMFRMFLVTMATCGSHELALHSGPPPPVPLIRSTDRWPLRSGTRGVFAAVSEKPPCPWSISPASNTPAHSSLDCISYVTVCSPPEDDHRCRQGVKPPVKKTKKIKCDLLQNHIRHCESNCRVPLREVTSNWPWRWQKVRRSSCFMSSSCLNLLLNLAFIITLNWYLTEHFFRTQIYTNQLIL